MRNSSEQRPALRLVPQPKEAVQTPEREFACAMEQLIKEQTERQIESAVAKMPDYLKVVARRIIIQKMLEYLSVLNKIVRCIEEIGSIHIVQECTPAGAIDLSTSTFALNSPEHLLRLRRVFDANRCSFIPLILCDVTEGIDLRRLPRLVLLRNLYNTGGNGPWKMTVETLDWSPLPVTEKTGPRKLTIDLFPGKSTPKFPYRECFAFSLTGRSPDDDGERLPIELFAAA